MGRPKSTKYCFMEAPWTPFKTGAKLPYASPHPCCHYGPWHRTVRTDSGMGELCPESTKPHYGGGFSVVLSSLHFLLLKKKKKPKNRKGEKKLLSQKPFNFSFTEEHHLVSPMLEVELIGEKVSVERVWGLEKWSSRKKQHGGKAWVGGQDPRNCIPIFPWMGDAIPLDQEICDGWGHGLAALSTRAVPSPPMETTPHENQR